MATTLRPGRISPPRQVPARIERPEYVGRRYPVLGEADVKDAETIEPMRVAGRIAAQALAEVGRHVVPGVTTDELDQDRARVPLRPRRLPEHAWLPRLSEVAVLIDQ